MRTYLLLLTTPCCSKLFKQQAEQGIVSTREEDRKCDLHDRTLAQPVVVGEASQTFRNVVTHVDGEFAARCWWREGRFGRYRSGRLLDARRLHGWPAFLEALGRSLATHRFFRPPHWIRIKGLSPTIVRGLDAGSPPGKARQLGPATPRRDACVAHQTHHVGSLSFIEEKPQRAIDDGALTGALPVGQFSHARRQARPQQV